MVTYPLSLPTGGFESIQWTARDSVANPESPFTYAGQAQSFGGQGWRGIVTLPPMPEAKGRDWAGWLASLHGQVGTFLLGDPLGATARGSLGGTPLVNGAGQTGNTLVINGASGSVTGWLLRGDYVQLGSGVSSTLHIVEEDADSDASGNVTLSIWPGMRTPPINASAVVTSDAKGLFKLDTSTRSWNVTAPWRYGMSFGVMEAI